MATSKLSPSNPDDVMPAAPEIRAGDLIEIRQPGKRKWAMRVERRIHRAWTGIQVRMTDGKPGRSRTVYNLQPGEYTIVEHAKPAAKTVAAETRPARVTTTVADDDNVPVLSKAQIDGLHWIGAPKSTPGRERYGRSGESPSVVTVKVLERYGLALLSPYRLTEAGCAAYLAHEPTGRLSKPFGDAWRAAKSLAGFDEAYSEQECGTTYDHKLKLISERDGYKTWECKECGAEVFEEPEPVYAHDAHCNTRHVAGPERCPEPEPPATAKPELPTLDELMTLIEGCCEVWKDYPTVAKTDLGYIRTAIEVLYREAGR